MIHCRRCGHGIVLRAGDAVPRCYCGGHEFDAATDTHASVAASSRTEPSRGASQRRRTPPRG